ncbi:MAG TPA: DMT family transporter [Mariprofundaceae bacterium]|nr:DMT family transporter [Mariprofundaceae bacterium]
MSLVRVIFLSALTMVAFAGNSLLCRLALVDTAIDAASFTMIRLLSGAAMLGLLVLLSGSKATGRGSWISALALFAYAAGFSFAYLSLPAGTGALILFGAVQATMIGYGFWTGERFSGWQWLGLVLAFGGLVVLLLPGLSAPPLPGSMLMLCAGMAWGVYSLRGKGAGPALHVTAANFLLAVPVSLLLSLLMSGHFSLDMAGLGYAVASGALASGVGYAIWYTVLPALKATHAATVQLSVPVLAALGGVIFLAEPITVRLVIASVAILGGIALVMLDRRQG